MRQVVTYKRLDNEKSLTVRPRKRSRSLTEGGRLLEAPAVRCFGVLDRRSITRGGRLRGFHCNALTTGSPSSKYEHRRASALLRNIQNIRICMGKKPTVSVTYENERISVKTASLPYLKCVLRLSCVVHGPNYGRFMGFYVNGFLSI